MRFDNAGAYDAARDLTRATPTDPLALWAYLYTLGGRQLGLGTRNYNYSGGADSLNENAPPLEAKDELDHVLACYQALRTRRPELAQAQVLQNVSDELKRAKRTADEERFYRDAVANSQQFAQVAGAFTPGRAPRRRRRPLPAPRPLRAAPGGPDILDLLHRLLLLRRTRPGPGRGHEPSAPGRKAYDDVLKILDYEMTVLRRRLEHQSPGAAAARQPGAVRDLRGRLHPAVPDLGRQVAEVHHASSSPCRTTTSTRRRSRSLREAFELYKQEDLVSDLVAHFQRQAEAASNPADAAYPRLCASYVLLWNGDKDEAIAEFTRVAETSRAESGLRLELAELLEQQGDRDDALAAADAVQPLDNATMKRREELALRVAVLGGNLERARQAAERLFGLRLDTDTQVRLSGQMHQLGLHELAEAVLGRARRRAGNKAAALVSLMIQYQRQDKLDVAVQVAMQILRSTTGDPPVQPQRLQSRRSRRRPHRRDRRPVALRPAHAAHRQGQRAAQEDAQLPCRSTRRWPTTTRPPTAATRCAPSWPRSCSSAPTT